MWSLLADGYWVGCDERYREEFSTNVQQGTYNMTWRTFSLLFSTFTNLIPECVMASNCTSGFSYPHCAEIHSFIVVTQNARPEPDELKLHRGGRQCAHENNATVTTHQGSLGNDGCARCF